MEPTFIAFKSKYNITVSSTVLTMTSVTIGFTAAELTRADRARVTVRTNDVVQTEDGVDPSATDSHLLPVGFDGVWSGRDLVANLRFLRAGASDGKINITLYERQV